MKQLKEIILGTSIMTIPMVLSIACGILFVLVKIIPEISQTILGILGIAGIASPFLGSSLIPEGKKKWVVMAGGIVVVLLILSEFLPKNI